MLFTVKLEKSFFICDTCFFLIRNLAQGLVLKVS